MDTTSKFWNYILSHNIEPDDLPAWLDDDQAKDALAHECPKAADWVFRGEAAGLNQGRWVLPALLWSLRFGAPRMTWKHSDKRTPIINYIKDELKERVLLPANVVIKSSPASLAFELMLWRRTPRCVHSFLWYDLGYGKDGFHYPTNAQDQFLTLVRHRLHDDLVHVYNSCVTAAAVGFIRADRLVLYPFPVEWPRHVEAARTNWDRRSAAQKASIELRDDLEDYVALFGKDKVQKVLDTIKA